MAHGPLLATLLRGTAWTREGGGTVAGQSSLPTAHPSALTNLASAAEQRQVWSRSPSLGPWHPPLRSTHRVGSVGQVRTGKINGAGAGLVGGAGNHLARQGPPWRLSAQHRPRTKADVIQPGSGLPGRGLEPALLPIPSLVSAGLSWPRLASPGLIRSPTWGPTGRPPEPNLWHSALK